MTSHTAHSHHFAQPQLIASIATSIRIAKLIFKEKLIFTTAVIMSAHPMAPTFAAYFRHFYQSIATSITVSLSPFRPTSCPTRLNKLRRWFCLLLNNGTTTERGVRPYYYRHCRWCFAPLGTLALLLFCGSILALKMKTQSSHSRAPAPVVFRQLTGFCIGDLSATEFNSLFELFNSTDGGKYTRLANRHST